MKIVLSIKILLIALLVNSFVISSQVFHRTEGRMEEILDASNENLRISLQSPDHWNSGKLSAIILNVDWKLNGLFATNFATKLFSSQEETPAFFAVINSPSLAKYVVPFGQQSGLLSFLLSQYVTINRESDLTLSDGSSGHLYSISVGIDQLRKLKAPIDKALDVVLINTQQQGNTYFVVYATEHGRMGQYQGIFDNMLNSIMIGTVSISATSQNQIETPRVPTPSPTPGTQTSAEHSGPSVSINPSCGPADPGLNIIINGNGFGPSINVNWKIVDSSRQIPLYGYFQTNAMGGFNDSTFVDDLEPGKYKIYFGSDEDNDNKFDAGAPTTYADISIPCP